MIRTATILLMLTGAAAAQEARRTASWYVANPAVMTRVLAICRDDPGHTLRNPDCMNARHAELLIAEREALRAADLTPPNSPAYWSRRPLERAQQLFLCGKLRPEDRAAFFCDAAGAGR